MESLVLTPEELCLGPVRVDSPSGGLPPSALGISPPPADLTLWSNEPIEKGAKFLPWKGTVRSDSLPVFDKLPEFDIRHRFGLYDEISEVVPGRRIRQCNWIRFLRYSLVYTEAVNLVGTKSPTGEPVYEAIKDIGPKSELIAFFIPERPEESFLLPAIQYLRHTLFKRIIDNVLEESPLDLSTSLVSKVFPQVSPAHHVRPHAHSPPAEGGRKSVGSGSDCTSTSHTEGAEANNNNHALHALNAAAAAHASLLSKSFLAPPTLLPPPAKRPRSPPHILSVESLTSKTPSTTSSSSFPSPPITSSSPFSFLTASSPSEKSLPSSPSPSSPLVTPATPPRPTVTRRKEKNMLPCSYCGKCFDRPSLLKRHIRIHTGERPHVCDVCNKGFSTSSSLNTHRRIHSGEKPHQCNVCGKRFTASSNLYYHKMTHVKEKPHKCTMCSKSFPTPGDLKSHMYVHTGTWPFKCHICHRGFSKQTNLKNHLLLHSGDKPFSCNICHKKFALSCNLRVHLKTHEAEYQNSAASLALYQRALAVLGSQAAATDANNTQDDTKKEGDNEGEASRTPSPERSSNSPSTTTSEATSRLEFAKQLQVAV